jgi:hypothetical protein
MEAKIILAAEPLPKANQQALLNYIHSLGVRVVKHSDGSRINLDGLPRKTLRLINRFVSAQRTIYDLSLQATEGI